MARDTQGRYSRSRIKKTKLFFTLLFIGFVGYTTYKLVSNPTVEQPVEEVVVDNGHQSEIDKIKDRENFKKRMDNQAKQVFLSEEISNREAQINALKAEIAGIEKDLETTRTEELSLQ